ncbi:MAG TPA: diacylglycerol kinase family protein [Chthoniobacterales bacterium]|nr:diacylglycerol kinase family protein [Chthoniobacterales bacterium]
MILNRAAGAGATTGDQSDDAIVQLFAQQGKTAQIRHPDATSDLTALAQEAAAGAEEMIVAGGGDGTISAVAAALAGTGKALGILPMGTLNHFAKDLGLPRDLAAAVATIAQGQIAEVDLGEVNGRVFINNSSLGLYPHMVAHREAQQERLGRRKGPAFLWAMLHAFRRFPFLQLRVTIEGKQLARRTAFLFVGNNEYEIAGLKLGGRACLNAGRLGLYLAHRTGRLGLFRLGWNALLGRLHQEKDFDSFCVEEATIETRRPRLLVATDGEVNWMATPLHYRVRPRALRVVVPQANAPV